MPKGPLPEHTPISKLGLALAHPERVRILMAMSAPARRMSAKMWSEETELEVGNASYHFRALEKLGCVILVDEVKVRGAREKIYEPVRWALGWRREWNRLPAIVKQNIAAVSLIGYVESLGRAIDAGKYDEREDSSIAYDTFWTDERGWSEVTSILNKALEDVSRVTDEIKERLDANPEVGRFLMSYGMSAFETAPEDE